MKASDYDDDDIEVPLTPWKPHKGRTEIEDMEIRKRVEYYETVVMLNGCIGDKWQRHVGRP